MFHVPPVLIVVRPVKIFEPVAGEAEFVKVEPLATVVVPEIVNANPAAVNAAALVPSPTSRFPPMTKFATVAAVTVPLIVRSPLIEVPVLRVFAPDPVSVRLLKALVPVMVWEAAPLKITVPVFAGTLPPPFVQLPLTVRVFAPIVSEPPELIVMLLQKAAAPITG